MSEPDIPAGWQPDPRGRHEYRYWDGTQWTDHVSDQGTVSSDPVADTSESAAQTEQPAAAEPDPEPAVVAEPEPVAIEPEPVIVPDPEPVIVPDPEPVVAHDPEPVIVPDPEPVVAHDAEPVVVPDPEPTATQPTPSAATTGPAAPASSAPPGGATQPSTAQTDAKAAAQDMLSSRSPELATILTAVVPGSGHFYMGTDKVPLAAGLLVATLAAVVLSHFSFLLFVVGFVIWLGAVVFGLTDLRGGVRGLEDTVLPKNVVAILLIGAGALLVISLLLPYYRFSGGGFSVSGSGFESFGIIDIVLLVVGIGSIVAGAASLGLGPVSSAELPSQLPLAVAIGGAVATVLILFRMFVDPVPDLGGDADVGRSFGIWLGLWSSMILVIANAAVLRSLANQQGKTS